MTEPFANRGTGFAISENAHSSTDALIVSRTIFSLLLIIGLGTAAPLPGNASAWSMPDPSGPAPMTLSDSSFLAMTAISCMEAIEMAALASQHASDPGLRALAARISQDQTATLQKIRYLAEAYAIELPASGTSSASELLVALGVASKSEFDEAYMRYTRMSQISALAILKTAAAEPYLSLDMRTLANNLMALIWDHRHSTQKALADHNARANELSLRM